MKKSLTGWGRPSAEAGRYYARPLIPLLLAFAGGIVIGDQVPGLRLWAGLLAGLSFAGILGILRRRTGAVLLPLFLFFSLGYLSLQPWAAPRFPADHVVHQADRYWRNITGVLHTAPADHAGGRIRFLLRASHFGEEDIPVSGMIRVTVPAPYPDLSTGDVVSFSGNLRLIRSFANPGGFDYARFMAYQGLWTSVYARKGSLTLLEKGRESPFRRKLDAIRRGIARRMADTGPDMSSAVLSALIVGDKSGISDELRDRFARAGVAHLLAISGLHVGIVATLFFWFFHRLMTRSSALLWRGWTRQGAALCALVPVFGYGLIAGMSPATQRALVMVAAFLTAFWVRRETDAFNTLALAALILLAAHPPALFSLSFQLSFAAVLTILTGMARFPLPAARDETISRKLFRRLTGFLLVSLFAILGTLPLTMHYFNQISITGLAANLIFIPLIGFGAVPLGLAGVLVWFLSPAASLPVFEAAAALLDFALYLLPFFADLPFGAGRTITPNLPEMVFYYLLLRALLRFLRPLPADAAAGRRQAGAVALLALLFFVVDAGYWTYQRFFRNDLRITIIDIGQGSAALVEMPKGECLLVDGGGFFDNTIFDVGERVVAPLLWRKKIRTVETLILSHPDSDHLNGLLFIADRFHVDTLWTNGVESDSEGYRELMETARRRDIDRPLFRHLERRVTRNGIGIEILYPLPDFRETGGGEGWRGEDNNTSLVVRFSVGNYSILFPGDIETEAEAELITQAGDRLRSTVLVAPHHGCGSSSSAPFIDAVAPEIVIASAGWRNRYSCPHPDVLDRYRQRDARIFRTDRDGAVEVVTDGRELTVRSMRQADWD